MPADIETQIERDIRPDADGAELCVGEIRGDRAGVERGAVVRPRPGGGLDRLVDLRDPQVERWIVGRARRPRAGTTASARNLDVHLVECQNPRSCVVGLGVLAGEPDPTELGGEDDLFHLGRTDGERHEQLVAGCLVDVGGDDRLVAVVLVVRLRLGGAFGVVLRQLK